MVHIHTISAPLLRHAHTHQQQPRRRALHCVATATADDLLIPATTNQLPPPPSQRPRFDDDDTPTKRRPPPTKNPIDGRQPHRNPAPRPNRHVPPLPASVSPDDVPRLIDESVGRVTAFINALDAADLAPNTPLSQLKAGMLGNDRPPAHMRRSQLIHAAYVAGHAIKHAPPGNVLPAAICRDAQVGAVCLLALGANAPHAPSYPQMRKLLTALHMAPGRLEGVYAALLSYTVLRTMDSEADIVALAKALDVWQNVGIITHVDQERFAKLFLPSVKEAERRLSAGLSPALGSDVCEAAAQCFAVWSRVRYLPMAMDMQRFMELVTHALPHASSWQAAMILRNATNMGVWTAGQRGGKCVLVLFASVLHMLLKYDASYKMRLTKRLLQNACYKTAQQV